MKAQELVKGDDAVEISVCGENRREVSVVDQGCSCGNTDRTFDGPDTIVNLMDDFAVDQTFALDLKNVNRLAGLDEKVDLDSSAAVLPSCCLSDVGRGGCDQLAFEVQGSNQLAIIINDKVLECQLQSIP